LLELGSEPRDSVLGPHCTGVRRVGAAIGIERCFGIEEPVLVELGELYERGRATAGVVERDGGTALEHVGELRVTLAQAEGISQGIEDHRVVGRDPGRVLEVAQRFRMLTAFAPKGRDFEQCGRGSPVSPELRGQLQPEQQRFVVAPGTLDVGEGFVERDGVRVDL
jgi:hypothetical protein